MALIVLMGIISLFSDMSHEGMASIAGAYLALAGASAATIGFVSGLGELIGYSLRLLTGFLANRSRKYWAFTITGYIIDCIAIPMLALVPEGGWVLACGLIVTQRIGKAIRKPSKDAIMSFAASREGVGKGFAVQETLDQIGAFLGPVLLFAVMAMQTDPNAFSTYSLCFAVLGIPAAVAILVLLYAWKRFPNPEDLEPVKKDKNRFTARGSYVIYMVAISVFALGFIDFSMITMHVARSDLMSSEFLPLLYASAMLIDAVAALVFGYLYDRYGMGVLAASTLMSAFLTIPVFIYGSIPLTVIGVLMWGVGMGAQESILKSVVTQIVPKEKRTTGFGVFQTFFGIFWFVGSWAMGVMYDRELTSMVVFSVVTQVVAMILFISTAVRYKMETVGQTA